MVSTKVLNELRRLYDSDERVFDIHECRDRLFDVALEINTTDSFVAGIASKILDQGKVTAKERLFISKPLLEEGTLWRCDDGETFDLGPHPEVMRVVTGLEKLRVKCEEALK
jgi:hypothetical protein